MKMILAVVASFLAVTAMSLPAAADDAKLPLAERGCTLCHREAPSPRVPGDALPLAPSWHDIAARYRGRADAEERLTRIVIGGADPGDRHWKDRIEFTAMRGNAPRVSPDEARAMVRWILSQP